MLHLLIPAAGDSRRFREAGFIGPKGLIHMVWKGRRGTMISHVIDSVGVTLNTIIGVSPESAPFFEDRLPIYERCIVYNSQGQASTVVAMTDRLHKNDEILVVNCDNAFDDCAPMRMVLQARRLEAVAATLVFKATGNRYGYVDTAPFFTYGEEKNPISEHALAGAFYFRTVDEFQSAWLSYISGGQLGETYLSGMFKYMVGRKLAVKIAPHQLHEWGTPQTLREDITILSIG